jgi:microcystin-dependent protein
MASTFSPSLRIELVGDGDQSGIWGQTTNNNLGALIEQAIAGVVTITMADANYTMTNFNGVADEARNQVLVLTGTNTAQRNLIAPLVEKTYVVKNSTVGGFAVQIIGASGTGVVIPNGVTTSVYCDGINFYTNLTGITGNFTVAGSTTLSGALAYGGVTLANSVTGTGSMALSASPTFTGVPAAPTAAAGTNTTQIATTAFVLANGAPTAGLIMWPTGTAPSGWLLCDGTAVSRTTYAALFAIIGTTFGAGDTTTTFNLPNYTNRMPYGTTVGATGGSADAIVVSHTHTATSAVTDPGHAHTIIDGQVNTRTNPSFNWVGTGGASVGTTGASVNSNVTNISVATTVASAGSSGTNANLPPYLGINFIIKT